MGESRLERPGGPFARFRLLLAALAALATVAVAFASQAQSQSCASEEVTIGIVHASGCFETVTPADAEPYQRATEAFMLNGFEVAPASGTHVDLIPASDKPKRQRGAQVKSSGALTVTAGTGAEAWHWDVPGFNFSPPSSGEFLLFQGKLSPPAPALLGLQPGIGVDEPVSINEEGGGSFGLSFDLASLMKMVDKNQTFGFDIEVEEDGKLSFAGVKTSIKGVSIAKLVEISELDVEIKAKNGVVTGFGGDIDGSLAAIENLELGGGFLWEDQALKRLSFAIGDLNVPLGPSGIFLQRFGFDVFLAAPYGGKGSIGMTAGKQVRVFGTDVSAVKADASLEIRGADVVNRKPPYFVVNGGMAVINIPVANAHFRYDFGVGTEFGARIGIGLPSLTNDPNQPTYVGGGVEGWTTANHFLLKGDGEIKALGIELIRGDLLVSDIGAGVCTKIAWWWGGFGVRWSDGLVSDIGGGTCDIGRYEPSRSASAALAAGHKASLHLMPRHEIIRVRGDGEPPQLTLRHASGRELHTPAPGDENGMKRGPGGISLAMNEGGDTAYFMIRNPRGQWTVDPHDSSAEVQQIAIAKELPEHGVDASITGRGRNRTLSWDARRIRDQKLVFAEVLRNGKEIPIMQTRRHSGSERVRLASGLGTYGKRKLRVHVLQRYETPRDVLMADLYRVRPPRKPQRPRHVRAVRRMRDLVVRWQPGARSVGQQVVVRTADGTRYEAQLGRHARRHRFKDISTGERVHVRVRGVDRDGIEGPSATTIVKASGHVAGLEGAVRRLLRSVHAGRTGNLAAGAACPAGPAHCELTVRVRKGGRGVGSGSLTLPPDMTDRLRIELNKSARRQIRAGSARVHVRAAVVAGEKRKRGERSVTLGG